MMLTPRQQQVLELVQSAIREHGYPPTVREIASRLRLAGPKSAKQHLDALVTKGVLRRQPNRPRALQVVGATSTLGARAVPILKPAVAQSSPDRPVLAIEHVEGHLALDQSLVPWKDTVLVRVHGESMTGAGLYDGDLVLVRVGVEAEDGEIVVVVADGAVVIRRLYRHGPAVTLVPANPRMRGAIISREAGPGMGIRVLGTVVGLVRVFSTGPINRGGQALARPGGDR